MNGGLPRLIGMTALLLVLAGSGIALYVSWLTPDPPLQPSSHASGLGEWIAYQESGAIAGSLRLGDGEAEWRPAAGPAVRSAAAVTVTPEGMITVLCPNPLGILGRDVRLQRGPLGYLVTAGRLRLNAITGAPAAP